MENKHLVNRVVDMAVSIQQIPAPTFSEQERAAFVQGHFLKEGLSDVHQDQIGNVYGCLLGQGLKRSKKKLRPILVSAHLDTVFPPQTDLSLHRTRERITGPGIGDNSLGVAGLFGLLWLSRLNPIEEDIWFVANIGEEGLGNLRGMEAAVEKFKNLPKAYLVLEGMALGTIYHRGLSVQRFRITVCTAGGHSWVNFGQPSAIHVLAQLINRLGELPVSQSGKSGIPRSSYNVGVVQGGSSVNTIASEAWLELDLRSESAQHLASLVERLETFLRQAGRSGEARVEIHAERIGSRPSGAISVDHPLVQAVQQALVEQDLSPRLDIGSTDANLPLSRGYPAVCIGLTRGGGAHSISEYIEIAPLAQGLAQLEACVREIGSRLN